MRHLVLTAAALVALHCASAPPPQETVVVGSDLAARIDAVFADYARPDAPGCAVAVARGGRTLHARGYGSADLEHDVPITPATIFEAGSVSKQFAAAAVVMLARDGKLSLDDPVRKHLPELHESASAVTVRQLLDHTSGLRDFGSIIGVAGWPRGTRAFTHADVLEVTARQKALNFAPGTQWTYNTGAYNLLAIIAERVSGQSLPELTRERIFAPLGMADTSWDDDYRRIVKRRAQSYSKTPDGAFRSSIDVESIYGNCCLLTTVGDLLRWNENFTTAKAVGREALDEMRVPAKLADGRRLEYGLGLFINETPGRRAISHSGATAGYRAFLTQRFDEDLSIALLCNRGDAPLGDLVEKVANAVEGRSTEATASRRGSESADIAGLWRDPESGAILAIDSDEGSLRLRPRTSVRGAEVAATADGYRIGRSRLRLEKDGLHLVSAVKPEVVYVRVERVAPSAAELAEYAGPYRSDEADVTWTVAVVDGRLVASPRAAVRIALDPLDRDGFITDDNDLVRFTRDAGGRVDGLEVKAEFSMADGTARLERLRFVRE